MDNALLKLQLQQHYHTICMAVFFFNVAPSSSIPIVPTLVWGFSFLSVTVISAFSLTGVFIVPVLKTSYMKYVLSFFIALAIGTLYSTSILQLLPEVCHLSIFHMP